MRGRTGFKVRNRLFYLSLAASFLQRTGIRLLGRARQGIQFGAHPQGAHLHLGVRCH